MNSKLFKELFGKKKDVCVESEPETSSEMKNDKTTQKEPVFTGKTDSANERKEKNYSASGLVVLLDNGHAKSTSGKRSPLRDDGTRFYEWEFNRDVVKRIASGLDKLGIKYHILVPENDKDIALTERANRANKYCKEYGTKNCFFISVHSNAFGDGKKWETPGGWSVWTTVGGTKSDEYGKVLYDVAEEKLKPYGFSCRDGKVQGNGNEGPDYESNFTVIYKTWCPAILTENLFYTNKKECEWLMTDKGRQVIADIHVKGIRRIIENL